MHFLLRSFFRGASTLQTYWLRGVCAHPSPAVVSAEEEALKGLKNADMCGVREKGMIGGKRGGTSVVFFLMQPARQESQF